MRTLAKVPRIITSWLPRRAPKVLNSHGLTPTSCRNRPAEPSRGMAPAGEMWSVVVVSPSTASTRARSTSAKGSASVLIPWKKGGRRM